MFLLLELSTKDRIRLALFDRDRIAERSFDAQNRVLLQCVETFLQDEHREPQDIQGIMVVIGEGGFSSTRAAVTLANTFAYALRIRVLAITKEQASDPRQAIDLIEQSVPGHYIAATYSAEPNITEKKQ